MHYNLQEIKSASVAIRTLLMMAKTVDDDNKLKIIHNRCNHKLLDSSTRQSKTTAVHKSDSRVTVKCFIYK